MESERSLPCSQEPTNGPYPDTDESIHILQTYLTKIRFNITLPSTP
jgi:hypothetical protein